MAVQILDAGIAIKRIPRPAAERKAELAAKVQELAGNPEALFTYWRTGPGADKIAWGTDGDFTRCLRYVGKYLPDAGGFCQRRHQEIFGMSNAERDAKQEKKKG